MQRLLPHTDGYMPGSGSAGSCDSSLLSFLGHCAVFQEAGFASSPALAVILMTATSMQTGDTSLRLPLGFSSGF